MAAIETHHRKVLEEIKKLKKDTLELTQKIEKLESLIMETVAEDINTSNQQTHCKRKRPQATNLHYETKNGWICRVQSKENFILESSSDDDDCKQKLFTFQKKFGNPEKETTKTLLECGLSYKKEKRYPCFECKKWYECSATAQVSCRHRKKDDFDYSAWKISFSDTDSDA